jgi:hypothetical protein
MKKTIFIAIYMLTAFNSFSMGLIDEWIKDDYFFDSGDILLNEAFEKAEFVFDIPNRLKNGDYYLTANLYPFVSPYIPKEIYRFSYTVIVVGKKKVLEKYYSIEIGSDSKPDNYLFTVPNDFKREKNVKVIIKDISYDKEIILKDINYVRFWLRRPAGILM